MAMITGFRNGESLSTSDVPDSPLLTTSADSSGHVDPYSITAAPGTLSASNYDFTFVDGPLTISPAALTITADNQSMIYGSSLPTLTANYSGLANGDTADSLATPPTLTTTATASSHVADNPYSITASGA